MNRKPMRALLLLLAMLSNTMLMNANPITKGQATSIASKYISNPTLTKNTVATRSLQGTSSPAYYIFTNSSDNKFVIISGESSLNELVAYGDNMSKDENNQPPYFKTFLKAYEQVVNAVRTKGVKATAQPMPIKRKVEPLLTCKWSQYYPFNKYTPVISGRTTPTGCVATATAQVMYYHKWPKTRPADYVRTEGDDAWKSTTYWWDDMKDTAGKMYSRRSEQAVGVFMRDIGNAVRMRYYHKGSDSNLQYACNALRDKFDYTVRYLDKDVLPANEFHSEVMQELSNGYPVLVVGGPHAFVYDGYDERGFIHTNWGWGGESDGYFDINTIYLNVHGFALSGTFWDDMSVVFAHPNNGKASRFKDIERGLDARTTTAFTISKTDATRQERLSAKISKLGSYSSVKGELGVFTGKVALALYNDKNQQVKIYPSVGDNVVWASIFTNMTFEVYDIHFDNIANGNYRLVPVYSEMLNATTKQNGPWKPINHANEMQVKLTSNAVHIETGNPHDVVVIEKRPSVLAPFYEDSGNMAAFSFTMYNPGREEVRGDLVMKLTNVRTKQVFNGYLLTPNVVAQRLGRTSFTINMLAQYFNSGRVGALAQGKYSVDFAIKVKRNGAEVVVPIDMKEPFEIEVLPYVNRGSIQFNFVDYLVDGENANYSIFQLNKIRQISLQVHAKVSGYQIKNGYRGSLYYRLFDLTSDKWIDLGVVNNVYLPCDVANNAVQTRISFAASKLEPNHSYEIHLEIERDGKREDIWNPQTMRNVFYTVGEMKVTSIDGVENKNVKPKHIFSINGVRQTQAWDALPAGVYVVDGKKVIKK